MIVLRQFRISGDAALSIAAIDARILEEGRQRELLLMLKHEAQTISRELGCKG